MARRWLLQTCFYFGVAWLTSFACASAQIPSCTRIVSLAPSITEVLFDLGLGNRVVGVTRFCRYPQEAQSIPQVGGFYDLSIEAVVARHPTDVFLLSESVERVDVFKRMGLDVAVVDHTTTRGIRESYKIIGQRCGVQIKAAERERGFNQLEDEIRTRCRHVHGNPPLRVLVVVGRTSEGNMDSGVYISGRDGFYSDILRLLGAVNVRVDSTVAIPTLSREGIMSLKPDVVLEVVNVDDGKLAPSYMEFWKRFPGVPAVANNRVFLLTEDYASIPGPRYIELARKLSALLCG